MPPDWPPVLAALKQVVGNARSSVEELDSATLTNGTPYAGGIPALQGRMVKPEYRIARLTAHIYTHIGEILTARSTLGLDVMSFTGAMPATMA
ncbi:MAG: hypothetical protein EXR64_05365 [Dehalococcoidia bacterium]|nr:hypothetical protein [Dehalococcoidia bacterium]